MAPWVRPLATARFVLRNTDLAAAAAPRRPPGWQQQLAEAFGERGSRLVAIDGFVVLTLNNRACNTTFEVTSGGLLGAGSVDRATIGSVVVPASRPYDPPTVLRGERPRWWMARARAMQVALWVLVSIFALLLVAALGLLAWRLCAARRHGKAAAPPLRGSPFDDGLPRHLEAAGSAETAHHHAAAAVGSLEHSARRLGTSGGL